MPMTKNYKKNKNSIKVSKKNIDQFNVNKGNKDRKEDVIE